MDHKKKEEGGFWKNYYLSIIIVFIIGNILAKIGEMGEPPLTDEIEKLGYFIGRIVWPILIVYVYYRIKKWRNKDK